jgi:hypothetical protein
VFCASLLGISPVLAIDLATASGALAAPDTVIKLASASAFRFDDLADLGQHADRKPELRILLTEQAVDDQVLQELDLQRLERQARTGELKGVLITLGPDGATESGTAMALLPQTGIPFYTVYKAPALQVSIRDNRVVGNLEFSAPDKAFAFNANFSAPLFHETAPSAILIAEKAQASAPALAYLEMEQRLKAGDFLATRRLVTPSMLPQILDLETRAEDPEFVAQFTQRLPPTTLRRAQIQKVVLYPARAYLVIAEARESIVTLRESEGRWLIDD